MVLVCLEEEVDPSEHTSKFAAQPTRLQVAYKSTAPVARPATQDRMV